MKKYITTSKHPCYRSGLRIEQKHDNCFHLLGTEDELYLNAVGYVINIWLTEGWIEEIQEPAKKVFNINIDKLIENLTKNIKLPMKKYKVTDKHPVYREGLIYEEDEEDGVYELIIDQKDPSRIWETIHKEMIEGHMSEGWIEEVEQPEFTKGDMFSFESFCNNGRTDKNLSYDDLLDFWIKKGKK